jgi:GNAT superfamily N-acetyltransferase
LFTAEAARGQGVGRPLINAIYEIAEAAGISRVCWQTHETNRTAMRL